MATVTLLPVAKLFEGRVEPKDPEVGLRPRLAGGNAAGTRVAAPPAARQVRAAGTVTSDGSAIGLVPASTVRRPAAHRPRPVNCDRSYEPDLHGSRLTARGRLVVALVWAAMAVAMAVMITRPVEVPRPAETTTVVVRAGDTLWELAEGIAPTGDRRVTISQIVELNGLRSAGDIRPGDVLVVPARTLQ